MDVNSSCSSQQSRLSLDLSLIGPFGLFVVQCRLAIYCPSSTPTHRWWCVFLLNASRQHHASRNEQLFVAARGGNAAEVTQLLAAGADPDGHKNEVRAMPPCPHALSSCSALTTRTMLLHIAERQHRSDMGQLRWTYGDRAGAAGRGCRPQHKKHGTLAPPPPRARCCPPTLTHPPCAQP